MNDSIFAIVVSTTPDVRHTKFFRTREGAVNELRKIASDRRHKLGVTVTCDTEEKFSFIAGWEEYGATFTIVELKVEK